MLGEQCAGKSLALDLLVMDKGVLGGKRGIGGRHRLSIREVCGMRNVSRCLLEEVSRYEASEPKFRQYRTVTGHFPSQLGQRFVTRPDWRSEIFRVTEQAEHTVHGGKGTGASLPIIQCC